VTEAVASEAKIVITGTGRAGTTFLVAVLTDLGLDTGYRVGIAPNLHSGGLEKNIERPGSPRVVKAPGLSTRLRSILERGTVEIEHVIIPVRDLDVAAASRVRVARYGRELGVRGGFTGTRRASHQRDVLANMFYELVYTVVAFDLPHTFLLFPRFTSDWQYTYDKLGFLAPDKTADDFKKVIEARYDPTQIQETPLTRSERAQAALLLPWTFARLGAERLRDAVRSRGTQPQS
jgi:hypothetical protein